MAIQYRKRAQLITLTLVATIAAGCLGTEKSLHYLGDEEIDSYRDVVTQIDYPCVDVCETPETESTGEPRTLRQHGRDEIWDLTLSEALHIALANNRVIRSGSLLPAGTSGFLTTANPEATPTVYDPAIQESNVLFGRRGVEAALASFDAQFTTSMIWGRDEQVQNNQFFGGGLTPGSELVNETGEFRTGLNKQFAYGGAFNVFHSWDYLGSNAPSQLFPTSYRGMLGVEYRQPLWAGSGPEYTRIAGPIAQSFGGITGVSQGVVIARINQDISLADFEIAVRNMLHDVEQLYWELYLQYRTYDAAVTARNSALETWRSQKAKLDIGGVAGFDPADEAQARDEYFFRRALTQRSLTQLYSAEVGLRRVMGLPVNDGRVIRPADEPTTARFVPDWSVSLAEALTRRPELRRQKWDIKSLQLQLQAAKSLTNPRLDFVSRYGVRGFGDHLFGQQDNDGFTVQGFRSAYESLTQGNQTGWNLGFEFTMPFGFRSAHAQVQNIELRLAKAHDVLAAQELDISHELAVAFQALAEKYATAQSNFNRGLAARDRLEKFQAKLEVGTGTVDDVLRAQSSLAEARVAYHTSLVEYNQEIALLHLRQGTLLEHNNVFLAEGGWDPDAYAQAYRRAKARAHAFDAHWMHTAPEEFVLPGHDCGDYPDFAEPESLPSDEPEDSGSPPAVPPPPAPIRETPEATPIPAPRPDDISTAAIDGIDATRAARPAGGP